MRQKNNPEGKKDDYKIDDSVLELFSTHLANTDNQLHDRHTRGRSKRCTTQSITIQCHKCNICLKVV